MANEQQRPSIGRIVHFHRAHNTPQGRHVSDPCAAIVTRVHEPEGGAPTVDLAVVKPSGIVFVQEVPVGTSESFGPYWVWPPYVPAVKPAAA